MEKSAVFLDRDGTLIEGIGYLRRPEEIKIVPSALEAVAKINQNNFLAVVITNQSAIARGWLTEPDLQGLHRLIDEIFQGRGSRLDAFYYCPHHPEIGSRPYRKVCRCRKPKPGLLLRAAEEFNINLQSSYMIGDQLLDAEAGCRAGCQTILVKSGWGSRDLKLLAKGRKENQHPSSLKWQPDWIAKDILKAVEWILEQHNAKSLKNS